MRRVTIDGTCVALKSRICVPTTLASLSVCCVSLTATIHIPLTSPIFPWTILQLYLNINGAMGSPYHVSRRASYLLSSDEASIDFQAIFLIAESLAHPHIALLSAFVQQAVDRELEARFLLDEVVGYNKATVAEFLADWISLLRNSMSP